MSYVFLDTRSCYSVHALLEYLSCAACIHVHAQVAHAAKRSFVNQSTTRGALVRLREMFGNPLTPRFRGAAHPSS